MKRLNVEVPLNSLSFGFVAFNILKELYKQQKDINLFLTGNNNDVSAYEVDDALKSWLNNSSSRAIKEWERTSPLFRIWHINGSERQLCNDNYLLSFHETDSFTSVETNILQNQKKVFVSSHFTLDLMRKHGIENAHHINLGYDTTHFHATNKKKIGGVVMWLIHGKLEPLRKNHKKLIQTWIKKYGKNTKHLLNLAVTNPHLDQKGHNVLLHDIFGGESPPLNVNLLPYCTSLAGLNDIYNATSIVLDIGNEAWSLPSFHCVGLGKHAVLANYGGLTSWGNTENAVLVPPSEEKIDAHDGIFFHKGGDFNQGSFSTVDVDALMQAFAEVEKRYQDNPINEKGLLIPQEFTWEKTVNSISSHIE